MGPVSVWLFGVVAMWLLCRRFIAVVVGVLVSTVRCGVVRNRNVLIWSVD